MRRFALGTLIACTLAAPAGANGRPPASSTIHFRQGHESDVLVGLTFGAVISHDSGTTWHWFCEKAVGYGGMYDPDYSYSQSGAIFATTFEGLKVNRDGCTFAATPPGTTFMSQDELGPDHALYVAAADSADGKIYKSIDDGMTFPTSASPGMTNDWWQSVVVAPSDSSRVYLSGYRLNSGLPTTFLLFKSINGGAVFTAMSTTGFTTITNTRIDIVGVDSLSNDTVYAHTELEDNNDTEGVYRSVDGGVSWTKLLTKQGPLAVLVRGNGDLVVGTQTGGSQKLPRGASTWVNLPNAPHINCLSESAAGVVWACTLNYDIPGSPPIPGDGFGIMKSTDLSTWTGVLKYQNITAPVDCPVGTLQRDLCVGTGPTGSWCALEQQLGITSTAVDCGVIVDGAPIGGDGTVVKPSKGCCDTGKGAGPAALVLTLVVGVLLGTPRRRVR